MRCFRAVNTKTGENMYIVEYNGYKYPFSSVYPAIKDEIETADRRFIEFVKEHVGFLHPAAPNDTTVSELMWDTGEQS